MRKPDSVEAVPDGDVLSQEAQGELGHRAGERAGSMGLPRSLASAPTGPHPVDSSNGAIVYSRNEAMASCVLHPTKTYQPEG